MDEQKFDEFLDELTALSHKHGLAINGGLWELQPEDAERRYVCDEDSQLDFI